MPAAIVLAVLLLLLVLLVCIPGIVASCRRHRNAPAIWVLSVLLGWSFLGWVVALVWAMTNNVYPYIPFARKVRPVDQIPNPWG